MKMGTCAELIAIKNNVEYSTILTTDGYISFGGVNFLAIAKYNKEILFKIIKTNAENGLKLYQLGAVLPTDKEHNPIVNSEIIKNHPVGYGEYFSTDSKNVYSPLGISSINYNAFDEEKRVCKYDDRFTQNEITEINMRTYVIDFDTQMIKIYGERIGVQCAIIYFSELQSLNRDTLIKNLINQLDNVSFNKNLFENEDEYLLEKIKDCQENYLLTLDLLRKSNIDIDTFNLAYLNTLSIFNKSYCFDEVIEKLGLQEVA